MPRGRPRKVVVEPATTQPKKKHVETPKKNIEPAQEPIVTIFSTDNEPVGEPAAEPVIGEAKNIDESVQVGDTSGQSGSSAQLMWDRASSELERLEEARVATRARIDKAESQISLLQGDAYTATQALSRAKTELGDVKRQVAIQEQRVALAAGVPAASYSAKLELSRLRDECARAQEAVNESVKILEDAQDNLRHASALQDVIAAAQQEIAKIDDQAALMGSLLQEQKNIRGQELFYEVKALIEQRESRVADKERDLVQEQERLRDAQEAIRTKLADWPTLADRLIASHGIAQQTIKETPASRVMKAWIEFVRVLGQEGHSANVRVDNESRSLVDILALPSGLLADFMVGGNKWRKRATYDARGREVVKDVTNEIEVVEHLIREQSEVQKRRMELPAWWTR